MKTRILAAVALLPLLLIILLVLPSAYTTILVGLMAAVGAYELLWNTGLVKHLRLVAYTAAMAFLTAMWSGFGTSYPWAMIGILAFTFVLCAELLAANLKLRFEKIAICLVGGLLVPFLLSALVRLRCLEQGKCIVLIPFVLAFLSDTGAYFVGCAFGKHKLAPLISPKKSVEGVFGGMAGAGIFAVQYAGAKDNKGIRYCFRMKNYIGLAMLICAAIVFLIFPRELIAMYLAEGTSPADAQATLQYGQEYFLIMLVGLIPFAISQSYGSTLREMGETWAAGLDSKDYKVSPLFGEVKGLAKTTLFVGTHEIFYPDVVKFYNKLKDSGVDAELNVGEGMTHVYAIYPLVPESKEAFKHIVETILD